MVILPGEMPCNSECTFTPLINNTKKNRASCAFQKNTTTTTGDDDNDHNYLKLDA
jgi:hypothetical protein